MDIISVLHHGLKQVNRWDKTIALKRQEYLILPPTKACHQKPFPD